ncbi:hypothetical protein K2Y11_10655 [bacterium]|nr:hypothetical protein [bacterium]
MPRSWKCIPLLLAMLFMQGEIAAQSSSTSGSRGNASGPDELENELALIAQQLAKFLRGSNEDSLSIGEFTGPPQLSSHAGPGIIQLLNKALVKLEIRCLPRAKLGLQGKYSLDDRKATIRGELVDLSGKTLFTFTRDFANPATFATLFGPTGRIDPINEPNPSVLQNVVLNPQTTLSGPRVFASPNSPYGMEVCIKNGNDYTPRLAHDVNGLAFLKISRGEAYAIRLINNSPHDAAVRLAVDGISVFAFSENQNYKHFIVRRKASKLITGWHRTNQVSDEFLVTNYSKSAAAEILPNSPSLGTITASFSVAWGEGEPSLDRPAPEIAAPNEAPTEFEPRATYGAEPGSGAPGDEPDATGRGEAIRQEYKELRRFVGPMKAAVTIRYTKETNLNESGEPLLFTDAGDWLEVTSRSAAIKLGPQNLLKLSAGDIVRNNGRMGEWYWVTANKTDGATVNGFLYSQQASEYSIPFAPQ